ncbi:MAG TPA: hypothetical protein VHI31_03295 [Actinomycetota bacterium]|nr:hypothetical protein [Actinomycetota bacterium]
MTPERTAELVQRWVRFYTRELPIPIAERRVDEMGSDLHDHIAHERAQGTGDLHIALSILSRMARGFPADVSWRRRIESLKGEHMKRFANILIPVLGLILGVPAMLYGNADDSPGLVLIGLLLIAGTFAFGLIPALRSKSRVMGVIVGAAVVWLAVVGVAGWLENNF